MNLKSILKNFPRTLEITEPLLVLAPNQERFLERRFSNLTQGQYEKIEIISELISRISGDDLESYVRDYVWYCGEQIKEEIYFRRNGAYRLKTLAEANAEVYSNSEYMRAYMNALLMTQVWWSNHTDMLTFYTDHFLKKHANGSRILEIGPGHGLLLYLAATIREYESVEAWDISATSVDMTKECLRKMNVPVMPTLRQMDMNDNNDQTFDAIVLSEVLEHLEDPRKALTSLMNKLSVGGKLFIHVPINSPAPDHLFNMPTPEKMCSFLEAIGFKVIEDFYAPVTNYTLEKARKNSLTISCGYILEKSGEVS